MSLRGRDLSPSMHTYIVRTGEFHGPCAGRRPRRHVFCRVDPELAALTGDRSGVAEQRVIAAAGGFSMRLSPLALILALAAPATARACSCVTVVSPDALMLSH